MVVGVVDNSLAAFDASAQVKLDNVASALFVKEDGAIIGDEAGPINTVGQFIGGRLATILEVLQRGVFDEGVSAVWRPGHEEDFVTCLQRVFAPGPGLLLRLIQEGGVSYTLQSPRTNEN